MDSAGAWFLDHLYIVAFFIYGLAFIVMGAAILGQPRKGSAFRLADDLWLLACFGITQGMSEWLSMWALISGRAEAFDPARWLCLVVSFYFLFEFGRRLVVTTLPKVSHAGKRASRFLVPWLPFVLGVFSFVLAFMSHDLWAAARTFARYLLCFPGSVLTGLGLLSYYRAEEETFRPIGMKKYFIRSAFSFLLYGLAGGLIVPKGDFFPADRINTETFLAVVHLPVEFFRACLAITATLSVGRMLEIFNWETRKKLSDAIEREEESRTELERLSRRDELILNAAGEGIYGVDVLGKATFVNPAAAVMLGYAVEELVGRVMQDVVHREGDPEFHYGLREGVVRKVSDDVFRRKDGTTFPVDYVSAPLKEKDALVGAVVVFRDSTERRQAEERKTERKLRDITAALGEGLYVLNEQGLLIFMNPEAERLLGWTEVELSGKNAHEIIHPHREDGSSVPEEECPVLQVLNTGCAYATEYDFFTRKDGTMFPVSYISTPLREDGKVVACITAFRDITLRKKIEEEGLKANKLESIGILAGGIAHDFNNLLTSIMSCLSLAKDIAEEDGEMQEVLTIAQKASRQARDLTSQLLAFSRGAGSIREPVYITEILKNSVEFVMTGSNIRPEFFIEEDLRPVDIDRTQIAQAVQNLAINAKEAMPAGGSLILRAKNCLVDETDDRPMRKGRYVAVSVSDQGPGISEENIRRIFDPYFTTKKMGTQKGTGLGLAICYTAVKNHDGYIEVDSRVGEGSTFTIFLPVSERKAVPVAGKELKTFIGGGRVLVMEDEEIIRNIAGRMLSKMGYEAAFAVTGEEAVESYVKAKETGRPFDLVVMDLTIPGGMGGKETIKRLLELDPDAKAVLSSGYSDNPVMAAALEYGFKGVLYKPYEMEDLGAVIHRVLRGED